MAIGLSSCVAKAPSCPLFCVKESFLHAREEGIEQSGKGMPVIPLSRPTGRERERERGVPTEPTSRSWAQPCNIDSSPSPPSLSLKHTHTHAFSLSLSHTHKYTYAFSLTFHTRTATSRNLIQPSRAIRRLQSQTSSLLSLSLSYTHTDTHTHTHTHTD
ncbi:hypothetical protein KP509_12G048900 [Ceratopteris richardii]|uniref:Uncharacterized protein n=1 Tax=Ceratopteris richardii TaxID=49495 RepID=A0A8T2TND5_CERRI|nr:hypothetical protein KP509_12G048900 [Ceratopteris richardii]